MPAQDGDDAHLLGQPSRIDNDVLFRALLSSLNFHDLNKNTNSYDVSSDADTDVFRRHEPRDDDEEVADMSAIGENLMRILSKAG